MDAISNEQLPAETVEAVDQKLAAKEEVVAENTKDVHANETVLNATAAAQTAVASFGLYDGNTELLSEYKTLKTEIAESHAAYLAEHPELRAFLADYLQLLMHRKPEDVYAFTHEYFHA